VATQAHVSGKAAARFLLLGASVVAIAACQPTSSAVTLELARADLRDLITDVSDANAYRYQLTDDRGQLMGPTEIVWVPETAEFAGVYFTASDPHAVHYHARLATSPDLLNWTWRVDLADRASMPSIAPMEDGGYVVAWEQEPDPIHIVIAAYDTWTDLLASTPSRRFDVPITMPACGEGTPSIEHASRQKVDISFHYHADCTRDLQAGGSTDWTTWESAMRQPVDQALIGLGVDGHIGDRDRITFEGHELTVVEGQAVPEDWSTWRLYLYDDQTQVAEELLLETHQGSVSQGNPSLILVEIDGRAAIVVTLYLFTEGAAPGEDTELLFYRFL
jgi:hypothetical protein